MGIYQSVQSTVKMLTVTLLALILVASCQAACDKGCEVPVKHYEELGCEPVYAKSGDCCPKYYNCAKVEGRAADKCYLRGKSYNVGDGVDDKITVRNCAASCFCGKVEWDDFTCANIECPSELGGLRLGKGCFATYEDDQCCSTGQICPPYTSLAKCELDGKTYYEGQRFYPESDECLECLCKRGFEGNLVEPFCNRVNCGVELRDALEFRKNYGPTYYGTSRCCPIDWQDPSEIDQIKPAEKPSTEDKKCKFGNKEVKIGDKISLHKSSPHNPDISCECKIPPLVTCIQKPHETE